MGSGVERSKLQVVLFSWHHLSWWQQPTSHSMSFSISPDRAGAFPLEDHLLLGIVHISMQKKKQVIVYLSKYEQRKTKGGNRNLQMKARLQPLKFSKDDIITMLCTNKLLTISTISILIITAISSSYQSCEPLIPVGLRSYYLPAENPHAYRQNKQIKCYMYHCFQIYVNTL